MARRVVVVFETAWDRRQLEVCAPELEGRFDVSFRPPSDHDVPWDLDVAAWIDRAAAELRGRAEGVFSSSDYPGATVAGALSQALGLPGTPPALLLRAAHKYYSRIAQAECAPEVVPPFDVVDPARPETWEPATGFPCFVKPVKGAFSVLARRAESRADLERLFASAAARDFLATWMEIFDALVARYAGFEHGGKRFVAEGLIRGELVTVEGFCRGPEALPLGIVDSGLDPRTRSFLRFDCPSALPHAVQARMWDATKRVAEHLGLRDTCFNVELAWDRETDAVQVLEINPRIAGQFADLWRKVRGASSYEVALALCSGAEPPELAGGPYPAATSFPLRTFEPVRVARAPSPEDVRAAEALFPNTRVWIEVAEGDVLADFASLEDGASVRYGVVNVGASSRAEADERLAAVREVLGFRLEPV